MTVAGWGSAGASGTGPSKLFEYLPFAQYRDARDDGTRSWVEDFADAIGLDLDVLAVRFVNAAARAELLDPLAVPSLAATATQADAITAPTGAVVHDSMLDVLAYIAGVPYPFDSNLITAKRQALVAAGWDLLRYKGNRIPLLRVAAAMGNGVAVGWSTPPWQFAVILPDGEPSPGWGLWVPSTTTAVATSRPWLFQAIRNHWTRRLFPAWGDAGIGYSQFRAGYSGAGEPTLASGARINILRNEHFSDWSGAPLLPDNWNAADSGAGTIAQGTTGQINWEFQTSGAGSGYSCVWDMSAAAAGDSMAISQTGRQVDNQRRHRFELDYSYRQAAIPYTPNLLVAIYDETNALYYNATAETWGAATYYNAAPVSDSTTTRTRYAFDFDLNAAAADATVRGTASLAVTVRAACDGTPTSQITYTLFRAGLYQLLDADDEIDAPGERTLTLPLRDSLGWTTFTRGAGGALKEDSSAGARSYKTRGATEASFPYHAALSGRGYQSTAGWGANLAVDSDTFAGWTFTNCARTAASEVSPIVGETVATAPWVTASAVSSTLDNGGFGGVLTGNNYLAAGVWCKKLTADSIAGAGVCSVALGGTAVTGVGTAFAAAWIGRRIIIGAAEYLIAAVGGVGALTIATPATAAATGAAFSVSTDDVRIRLKARTGVTTIDRTFTVKLTDGWTRLACPPAQFVAGDAGSILDMTIALPSADPAARIALTSGYIYETTGRHGILHPPLSPTVAAAGATSLLATDNTTALHPLWLRQLITLRAGLMTMTVVPAIDPNTGATGTIFDVGEGAAVNRLTLYHESAQLKARLYDNAGTAYTATLNLETGSVLSYGSATWRRDTAIDIRLRWGKDTGLFLSAGNGSIEQTVGFPVVVSDAALVAIGIGNDYTGGAQFEGLIRDVNVVQVGPIT